MNHVKNRNNLIHKYDYLYEIRGNRYGNCTYCGIPASTLDHMPPISWTDSANEKAKEEMNFYKLPSCEECNNALGNLRLFSVMDRVHHVHAWLKNRYKKALRMPYWDEDELNELSYTMVAEVRKAERQSAWAKSRIVYRPDKELLLLNCYEGDTYA